ncbi:PAP3 [Symbiodinium sp. CCMP2592]|nr:PAP3 [Symbiodinium sp. CCMP2592]
MFPTLCCEFRREPCIHVTNLRYDNQYCEYASLVVTTARNITERRLGFTWLRVTLGFHTSAQVAVGFGLGVASATVWQFLYGSAFLPALAADATGQIRLGFYVATAMAATLFAIKVLRDRHTDKKHCEAVKVPDSENSAGPGDALKRLRSCGAQAGVLRRLKDPRAELEQGFRHAFSGIWSKTEEGNGKAVLAVQDVDIMWKKLLVKRQGASANMGALFNARRLKDEVEEASKSTIDTQQKKAMAAGKVANKVHAVDDACLALEKKAVKNMGVANVWRRNDLAVRSGGNGLCEIIVPHVKGEIEVRMCVTGANLSVERGSLIPMARMQMDELKRLLAEVESAKSEQIRLESAVLQCSRDLKQKHQKLIDQIEKELEELELRGTKFAREYDLHVLGTVRKLHTAVKAADLQELCEFEVTLALFVSRAAAVCDRAGQTCQGSAATDGATGQFPSELFGVPLQTSMAPFASCQRQTEAIKDEFIVASRSVLMHAYSASAVTLVGLVRDQPMEKAEELSAEAAEALVSAVGVASFVAIGLELGHWPAAASGTFASSARCPELVTPKQLSDAQLLRLRRFGSIWEWTSYWEQDIGSSSE